MVTDNPTGYRTALLSWLLGALLIFASLFRAGHGPIPLLVLQLCAVLMFPLSLWTPTVSPTLTKSEVMALALLLLFPLLFIVPLPGLPLDWLPGRDRYVEALALAGPDHPDRAPTLSLYPLETTSAWLTLLLPVAVFVATRKLSHRRLYPLILLLIAIAGAQAALGLMQFGSGSKIPLLYFGLSHTYPGTGSGIGTYTNRNHLAGLIEMVLPITFALFFHSLGRNKQLHPRGGRGRILFLSIFRGHRAFLYGALILLLIVGMIFTRSRTGIALTILGVLAVTLSFGRRIGGDNVYGVTGTIVAFALGIGIAIGLAPILDRFASPDLLEDTRWTIFSATLEGIRDLFPLGSGPGTYPDIFHAFHPLELGSHFINHAHNDYLEWLFEGGAFAALLIALLLGLYLARWGKVWTRETWSRFRFLQVGAGIGIFLLLLHELVDYNLFIPANMVYFAFLAGIFFSDPHQQAVDKTRRSRGKRSPPASEQTAALADAPGGELARPTPDQIRNPFLD